MIGVKQYSHLMQSLQSLVDSRVAPAHIPVMKIEEGVPVAGFRAQRSEERAALESMKVGDSFEFEASRKSSVKTSAFNIKFATKMDKEPKEFAVRGLRVWRIR